MREIYVEPLWKIHPAELPQFLHPPSGYRYVYRKTNLETLASSMSNKPLAVSTFLALNRIIPFGLSRAVVSYCAPKPEHSAFTYAIWHLVLRNEPWVMEVADVGNFALYEWQLHLSRDWIRRRLEHENCKYLICWFNRVSMDLLRLFGPRVHNKVRVVPRAVTVKPDISQRSGNGMIRLLFVGSASQRGEFESKGGPELLYAFKRIKKSFRDVELVIRSDIPSSYLQIVSGDDKIRIINRVLARSDLDLLYRSCDIFVCPSHYAPWGVILEAMSYGLPVVVCDVYGMSDLVHHMKEGYIISKFDTTYDAKQLRLSGIISDFLSPIRKIDVSVVNELVRALSLLISDSQVRRRMGTAAKLRIQSQNSYNVQRSKLKSIFDSI